MGVATAINFQPTGGGKAAITRRFCDDRGCGQSGLRALTVRWHCGHRAAQPGATKPRGCFMHFSANHMYALARGLRAALKAVR